MAKPRVEYVCEKCGGTSVKWQVAPMQWQDAARTAANGTR